MGNLDKLKAHLSGGGARANQFRVILALPTGLAFNQRADGDKMSVLCKATSLPAMNLGEIPVPFRGRQIYLAGDRAFDEPWTTTFLNDTDFAIRNTMEEWSNGINDLLNTTGLSDPREYQSQMIVKQLDRDDNVKKSYTFHNCWPMTISAIELSHDTTNAIEEFEVTWRYQSYEAFGRAGLNRPAR